MRLGGSLCDLRWSVRRSAHNLPGVSHTHTRWGNQPNLLPSRGIMNAKAKDVMLTVV